jgi:hypothetical protein
VIRLSTKVACPSASKSVLLSLSKGHGDDDVLARADDLWDPIGEERPDRDGLVAQQPIDLFDRMLRQQAPRLCQGVANHRYGKRRAGHDADRGVGKRLHPLGMHISAKHLIDILPYLFGLAADANLLYDHNCPRHRNEGINCTPPSGNTMEKMRGSLSQIPSFFCGARCSPDSRGFRIGFGSIGAGALMWARQVRGAEV